MGATARRASPGPAIMSSADKIKQLDTNDDPGVDRHGICRGSQEMFRTLDTEQRGYLTAAEMHVDSNKRVSAND